MPKQSRTKLVPPKMEPDKNQALETMEVSGPAQKEQPELSELDMEIECPRCHEFMELQSSFNNLMYSCENCRSSKHIPFDWSGP